MNPGSENATMTAATTTTAETTPFPPVGWVTRPQAARMLGVSVHSLSCSAWKWRPLLRGSGRCVRHPTTGGRCKIHPIEQIQRIKAAQAAAARPQIPEGFVDKDGACRFFDVSRCVWKRWIRQGKVRCGTLISSPIGSRLRIYAVAELERLKGELFGEDKLYKRGTDNVYHVPAGLVRREDACERFGVSTVVWARWEREGHITGGTRVPAGPKLYKLEDVERMLDEYGKYCPPYPDPDQAGVYRVPLGGRDIKRREALIDAESLSLIEGGNCHLAQTGKGKYDTGGATYVGVSWTGGRSTPLRRLIMGVADRERQVGHLNGDPLDCRRANLIVRTVQQRARGACKMKSVRGRPCTSRFKGVCFEAWTKKWRAKIDVNGKSRSLGRYGDEIAAAQAYDEAARRFFGTYARLNFPDGVDAWLEAQAQRTQRAEAA